MQKIQTIVGSAAVAAMLLVSPLAASAASVSATSSTGIVINGNGIVRVIGADVTAVGSGIVDAMAHIGNFFVSIVANTSAATKVFANGSASASTTDIRVGDKVNIVGSLSATTGNSFTIAATKVRDTTSMPRRIMAGTVASVNAGANSFTFTQNNRTVTVNTNASTSFLLQGSTSTLAALALGDKVSVLGSSNADGSVLTATSVIARAPATNKGDSDNDGDNGHGSVDASSSIQANVEVNSNKENGNSKDGKFFAHLLGGLHLGNDN